MITHASLKDFSSEPLPSELSDLATFQPRTPGMWDDFISRITGQPAAKGELTFVGQMTPPQRDALVTLTSDKAAIDELFEKSQLHDVPSWVPEGVRPHVELWFQTKWPAEHWRAVQGHQHHYVSWIFCGLVIALCMTSPRWWPGPRKNHTAAGTADLPGNASDSH